MPISAVDPIYHVDASYYLGPDKGGERAYRLCSRDALEHAGITSIASYSARGKQYVINAAAVRGRPRHALAALPR